MLLNKRIMPPKRITEHERLKNKKEWWENTPFTDFLLKFDEELLEPIREQARNSRSMVNGYGERLTPKDWTVGDIQTPEDKEILKEIIRTDNPRRDKFEVIREIYKGLNPRLLKNLPLSEQKRVHERGLNLAKRWDLWPPKQDDQAAKAHHIKQINKKAAVIIKKSGRDHLERKKAVRTLEKHLKGGEGNPEKSLDLLNNPRRKLAQKILKRKFEEPEKFLKKAKK
jgi:hypothetical protein